MLLNDPVLNVENERNYFRLEMMAVTNLRIVHTKLLHQKENKIINILTHQMSRTIDILQKRFL